MMICFSLLSSDLGYNCYLLPRSCTDVIHVQVNYSPANISDYNITNVSDFNTTNISDYCVIESSFLFVKKLSPARMSVIGEN